MRKYSVGRIVKPVQFRENHKTTTTTQNDFLFSHMNILAEQKLAKITLNPAPWISPSRLEFSFCTLMKTIASTVNTKSEYLLSYFSFEVTEIMKQKKENVKK